MERAPVSDESEDLEAAKCLARWLGIVAAIRDDDGRSFRWATTRALQGWTRLDEWKQLGDIASIRADEDRGQRNAAAIGYY